MNNADIMPRRKRHQNLLIVEGQYEKDCLFGLIFQCFPEINIDMDNIWIYGTNIYLLYNELETVYGADWDSLDVDLPFVLSRRNHLGEPRRKSDFVNIILIFDYERHDKNFSETKILKMQNYFKDATDSGMLYLNYPMIESYQHLKGIPDSAYAGRKIPVTLQPGKEYKNLVKRESSIKCLMEFTNKIAALLQDHYGIFESSLCGQCFHDILNLSDTDNLTDKIAYILQGKMESTKLNTAKYHFSALLSKQEYLKKGISYWQNMRSIFQQIIIHNICKANKIQNGNYQISPEEYKYYYEKLNLPEILKQQNTVSNDPTNGYIWVLNTCVFLIAEYNFKLVSEQSISQSLL